MLVRKHLYFLLALQLGQVVTIDPTSLHYLRDNHYLKIVDGYVRVTPKGDKLVQEALAKVNVESKALAIIPAEERGTGDSTGSVVVNGSA